jgi:hypothetical protein
MLKFEDQIEIINTVIAKRRNKWQLRAILDIDYEDVTQILKCHIYKQWRLWDQSRPLPQWLNKVISNQLKNLIRNIYGKFAPPCKDCPFNSRLGDGCLFTASGVKSAECSLYKKWEKNKKNGYNLLLAPSIDDPNNDSGVLDMATISFDMDNASERFHIEMKKHLTPKMWLAYDLIYIKGLTDDIVAKELGLKTNEEGRKPGYKQLLNIRSKIIKIAKLVVREFDVVYSLHG